MKIGEFRDLGADELKQREKDLDDQHRRQDGKSHGHHR